MFIRTGVQKCEPFPTHSITLSPIGHKLKNKPNRIPRVLIIEMENYHSGN